MVRNRLPEVQHAGVVSADVNAAMSRQRVIVQQGLGKSCRIIGRETDQPKEDDLPGDHLNAES